MTKAPKRPRDLNQGAKRMVDIATSEMRDREPTPPTSGESVANALDRWDEEGGAPAVPWPLPYETGDLMGVERRVLECLGAALVSERMVCPPTFSAGSSSTQRPANHTTLPY